MCLPALLDSNKALALALEWTTTGFLTMVPFLYNFLIAWRELALEISVASLGSNQIFLLPTPTTLAASLFWVLRLALYMLVYRFQYYMIAVLFTPRCFLLFTNHSHCSTPCGFPLYFLFPFSKIFVQTSSIIFHSPWFLFMSHFALSSSPLSSVFLN